MIHHAVSELLQLCSALGVQKEVESGQGTSRGKHKELVSSCSCLNFPGSVSMRPLSPWAGSLHLDYLKPTWKTFLLLQASVLLLGRWEPVPLGCS